MMSEGKRKEKQTKSVLVSLSHYTLIAILACFLCSPTDTVPLMDAKSTQVVAASEPLKYQTWFLKVSIHCEGCRRKVKKVLQSIDGVFTTTVDPQQNKVTVTGSVGVETLIRKLVKAGKHAEIWPENLAAGKGKKSSGKEKKNEKGEPENAENHSTTTNAEPNTNSAKNRGNEKNSGKRNGENKTTGNGKSEPPQPGNKGGQSEEVTGRSSEGGSGKKKKKKSQSGNVGAGAACSGADANSGSQPESSGQVMGQINLSPTRQQSYVYPESYCYPPLVYLATHNRLCPMGTMGGPSYYVSPLPYMCAGFDRDPYYQRQSTPLVPFEIFSDENANACCVM